MQSIKHRHCMMACNLIIIINRLMGIMRIRDFELVYVAYKYEYLQLSKVVFFIDWIV